MASLHWPIIIITIRPNKEYSADMEWWHTFIVMWNGTSILWPLRVAMPDVHIWPDTSGGWNCGAVWQGEWYQILWGPQYPKNPKELFLIMVAGVGWGQHWYSCTVCFHSDNEVQSSILISLHATDSSGICQGLPWTVPGCPMSPI